MRWGIPASAALLLGAAAAAPADEGLWPLNGVPAKALRERYGFEPPAGWLEHLQRSCARFSTGGSGSFASADGLVITNEHVGSDCLRDLSSPGRDLVQDGYLAKTRDEELKCANLELLVLWSIEDVTARVRAVVKEGMSSADALAARRAAMAAIEQESQEATRLHSEVVTLYEGGQFHLYRYRRYTDVRLVFAPEQQAAFFGGDADNFEYPRYDLDICIFRVYEDGKPLKCEHWLRWNPKGIAGGDLALVCGHPGDTQRLHTLEHLKFQRDVEIPDHLAGLWRSEVELQQFGARGEEESRISNEDFLNVQNSRKADTGVLAGLLDPAVLRRKAEAEARLRAFTEADPARKAKWGSAWDEVARALAAHRGFYQRHLRLEERCTLAWSVLFAHARTLVRLAGEKGKPSGERLREFRETDLESLYQDLLSEAPIHDSLEIDQLESGLTRWAECFGADDPTVLLALGGRSPRARAEELVRGTTLKDVASRRRLAEGGPEAIAASRDPMILLAAALDPEARALRRRYEAEVEGPLQDAYAKIAAAQFALADPTTYPDATFTLRLSFGAVRGYREGAVEVPAFTTLGGAFGHMEHRKESADFALPKRWLDRKASLALDTPFNFVCTADIVGGNSGSPVVDRAGEFVGIIFDGNIQGLVWDVAYTDDQARAVAVDARGILECLRKVYDAGALADEITAR
jgi:hypothetical protein